MMYSTERNEVINFLTNNGLSSEVALFNDLFDALENASFKTSYMNQKLMTAVEDIKKNIRLLNVTRIPLNVRINQKLDAVKRVLTEVRDLYPINDKKVLQDSQRIKSDVKNVISDYIDSAKSTYAINGGDSNIHTKGVNTGYAIELSLKNLYVILHLDKIVDEHYEELKDIRNSLDFKNVFPCIMDTYWRSIVDGLSPSDTADINSKFSMVKDGKESALYDNRNPLSRDDILKTELKINGHNTFGILSVLPEKIQTLIKYQILVRLTKDIDENIQLPSFDKFVTLHDFMMLIKDFDNLTYQELFKVIETNIVMYSNDFDSKRYGLNLISEDNYKFNLAFFTAVYIVLLHEYEDLDKYTCVTASELDDASLKTGNVLVVPKEYESIISVYSRSLDDLIKNNSDKKTLLDNLLNKSYFDWLLGLNKYNFYTLISKFNENEIEWLYNQNNTNKNNFEDTLYYFTYLKSYLKGLDLDLTDKNVERVSKFVELVNSTNDLSYLELQYNNWLGSIRIEDFTMEELDILEKFDPNYISGISNYSLKSYHYLCKKVNADFKGDVNIVGSRDAKHKAALYQYFADLGYSDIPECFENVDLFSALNVIKLISDSGHEFEEIPRYYFSTDSRKMIQLECVLITLIESGYDILCIPERFIPATEKECYYFTNLVDLCKDNGFKLDTIISSEKFNRYSINDLYNLLNSYSNYFNDTNILDLPDDVIENEYPVELSLIAYKYTCDVSEFPHYYVNQDYDVLDKLMMFYAENGLDVRTIPIHFIHFYYDGFTGKLKEMLDEGKDINSIDLSYFVDNSFTLNKLSSYFIYLASESDRYLNDSIYSKVYYTYKIFSVNNDISFSIILLTYIDALIKGKDINLLTYLDFNLINNLFNKYSYLNELVLRGVFADNQKFFHHNLALNVLSDDFRLKLFNEELDKSYKDARNVKRVDLTFKDSPLNIIRSLMTALGYDLLVIDKFIKNKNIIFDYNLLNHIISILNSYVDQGLSFDKIPSYLNLLDINNIDIKHLDRVVQLYKANNYSINFIPYYYLFDTCGNGYNGVYNLNVIKVLTSFNDNKIDFSQLPLNMINTSVIRIKSLIGVMKHFKLPVEDVSPSLFGKYFGQSQMKLFQYFEEKGVYINDIPEMFLDGNSNTLMLIKLYESIGVSFEELNRKLLNIDVNYLKEFIALGIDPRTVTDNQFKYGYYAAQYLDFVNNLEIEDGMVYLSQDDIAESFNMMMSHTSIYTLEELYNSKELLYKTTKELFEIIYLARNECQQIDLRMLYMPIEFIKKYFIFAVEYFKQYDGDMDYDKAYEVAKSISYRVDVIPEDMLDLDDESPTYTPAKVINEMLYVKRGRAFR